MNEGKLSFTPKGKNRRVINVAELERVYGSLKIETENKVSKTVQTEQSSVKPVEKSDTPLVEVAVLRERIDNIEKERTRERNQYEERIEHLEKSLDRSMEGHNNATRLLEHKKDGVGGIEETVAQLKNTVEELKSSSHETEQKSVQLEKENEQLKTHNELTLLETKRDNQKAKVVVIFTLVMVGILVVLGIAKIVGVTP